MKREWTKFDATLEARAYEYALRVALRKCGLYLRSRTEAKVIGLRLPPHAALDVYSEALRVLLKATEVLDRYHVALVALGRRGDTLSQDARDIVRMRSAVIVLIEHGTAISAEFELAFDRIANVDPVRPAHLMSAAREAWQMVINRDDASALSLYRPEVLFAALRRGRPVDVVLAKLASVSVQDKPKKWEPKLEELEGYGAARDWGMDLVSDIADWRAGKIQWSDVDAGLLLSGAPGTGKTLFASALARSCGAGFLATSSAQWQAKGHLGDMLGAMRRSFREAAESAPTVLFIDEIDSIGDRRTFRGDNVGYSMQVVNALLELLDGSDGREGVVVVAASNYPENIDAALRRPGRLDKHVELDLPDRAAREQMLALYLGDEFPLEHLKDIASAMSGYSGAHIAQLARDARRIARRAGREVDVGDLIDLVPPMMPIRGGERRSICLHEAGHAVVGLALEIGVIEMIVVAQEAGHRDTTCGHVQWIRPRYHNRSRESYLDEIALLLGGMAAERVWLGTEYDGSGGVPGSDLQQAVDLATLMLANLGLGALQFFDVSTSAELEELRRSDATLRRRVERLLEEQLDRAEEIVTSHRSMTEAIVALLADREVITGREVTELFRRSGDRAAS